MSKLISQDNIKMPLMLFLEKDIFIKNDPKFIVRKSSLPFYNSNHIIIIDSNGQVFDIDSIELTGNMIWWHFFKNGFYDYYNACIKVADVQQIDLKKFKEKIQRFIDENPKYGWNRFAQKSEIKSFIEYATSFEQLINYFEYFKA
ncbi:MULTISPECIES: hypothetical protein [unclassified Arcicella]|uniref:hypothetical protein n=1 Tax=unclassified Arcicella TaxID=2644986 RepID=UPI002858FE4A|nr:MULTISPECIES: hypothetical protein [unclassified Arcicella]MDR6564658.1 hypothetical protein [Arcicella sp. BE51]MDR6814414.1 hypothetical protein [Arcicella sp. BE140]MDR6825830.1 hypothetical protein [Arcicella sp. BE139]